MLPMKDSASDTYTCLHTMQKQGLDPYASSSFGISVLITRVYALDEVSISRREMLDSSVKRLIRPPLLLRQ